MVTEAKTPDITKYGAYIANCNTTAESTKQIPEAMRTLEAIANASSKHAEALIAMCNAIKGSGGTINTGISLSNINTPT